MFLDVTLYSEEAVAEARKIIEEWKEEHAGYYGTPAGAGRGFGFATLPGEGGLWMTSGRNYHAISIVPAPASWIWEANGIAEGVRVVYNGRRHGLRSEVRWLLRKFWDSRGKVGYVLLRDVHAYITQEPGWLPWETLDDHKVAVES